MAMRRNRLRTIGVECFAASAIGYERVAWWCRRADGFRSKPDATWAFSVGLGSGVGHIRASENVIATTHFPFPCAVCART